MKVLILGRTNVGKSSLFNRLIRKRKSLVINESGITRDLLRAVAQWWGHGFEVIDSGGLPDSHQQDELSLEILKKIKKAISQADVFVIVVDGKSGLHPRDFQIVKMARKAGRPFLLFVNKVDHPEKTNLLTAPFFELHPEFLSGSFENNYGVDDIVEWIISQKKKKDNYVDEKGYTNLEKDSISRQLKKNSIGHIAPTRLFVIGRANSGKSLLCNQILQQDRMIVSSQSGTTLDTVTDFFSYNKMDYSISDNPGSRRGHREDKEKISFAKSRSELETADIILLVMDAVLGPSRQEARLVQLCLNKHKTVLLVVNKMDLLQNLPAEEKQIKREEIKRIFHFYPDLPVVFMSAKTGYHKAKLFQAIEDIKQKINFRVSTSELNNFFIKVIRKAPAPVYRTSDVKFYYISQTNKKPPEFIAFANYPKGVTPAYNRFIINRIKKKWGLKGIPIAFHALAKR